MLNEIKQRYNYEEVPCPESAIVIATSCWLRDQVISRTNTDNARQGPMSTRLILVIHAFPFGR